MIYIGIDPGLKGAIAVIDGAGKVLQILDTPTITFKKGKKTRTEYDLPGIKSILKEFSQNRIILQEEGPTEIIVFLEKMQTMPPGIRSQASFSLGYSQGIFEAFLCGFEIAYQLVLPKTWQKHFGISKDRGDIKVQSFIVASKLFPDAKLVGPRGGKKDGRSDALLIAEWGKRQCNKI